MRNNGSSRRPVAVAPAALLGLVLIAAIGLVSAHAGPPFGITGSNFEVLDGNTHVDNPDNLSPSSRDWDGLNTSSTPDTFTATIKADLDSGSGDNSFGNGTKEDSAVPSVIDGSIPPNKSDLKEFGAWVEKNGSAQFLHLFWTRVQDPSGTTNMDFEFNKLACVSGGGNNVCSANGQTPVRSNNDLLVTYDLSRGGTQATISLRRWSAGAGAWGAAAVLDPTLAVGSINTGAIVSTILPGVNYSPRTFGEASINLAPIFGNGCDSFGSAYLKSRSSDSFTSAVKDFIAPVPVNVSNCGRLVVKKRSGSVTGPLLVGAGFTISPANAATPPVSTMSNVGVGNTGVFCIDSLRFGTAYTVHESTVPPNYLPGDDVVFTPNATANSGTCSTVTGSTPADFNIVNQLQTASIAITKLDDAASPAPLSGSTFTAYNDVAPVGGPNDTTARGAEDTTSAGSCSPTGTPATCTLASLPLGAYWIVETTTPTGYDTAPNQRVVLTVSGGTTSISFTDPRQFKIITLVCKVAGSKLYPSTVKYNGGSSQTSLAAGVLSDADQAALCGLTGATVTVNKSPAGSPHTSTIAIN